MMPDLTPARSNDQLIVRPQLRIPKVRFDQIKENEKGHLLDMYRYFLCHFMFDFLNFFDFLDFFDFLNFFDLFNFFDFF